MEQFLEAGQIVATHGVRGELKVLPWADGPEFLLEFDHVYIDGACYDIEQSRVHKTCALLKLAGIDSPEEAAPLMRRVIRVDRTEVELEEGVHFHCRPHRPAGPERRRGDRHFERGTEPAGQ